MVKLKIENKTDGNVEVKVPGGAWKSGGHGWYWGETTWRKKKPGEAWTGERHKQFVVKVRINGLEVCSVDFNHTDWNNDKKRDSCNLIIEPHGLYENGERYALFEDAKPKKVQKIVMSCPQQSTLDEEPCPDSVYDQACHQQLIDNIIPDYCRRHGRGSMIIGFDWAGSSNVDERDQPLFDEIFARDDEGNCTHSPEEQKELVLQTMWFGKYGASVKQTIKTSTQNYDELVVICIQGGPITQVEHEQMDRLINEAKSDVGRLGYETQTTIEGMTWAQFLAEAV